MRNELLLIALFMAATALTSGEYVSSSTTTPKTVSTSNSTTPAHSNTSFTPTPQTHNTTAHVSNITTISPNVTTSPSNVTTPHPNTTTAHTTTPVPRPTAPANTTVGNYSVRDLDKKTCILAEFAVVIRVNNSQVNGTFIVQPLKTNASGPCDPKVSSMFLTFNEGGIVLKFRNNDTSKMVYVETLEYDLTYAFKYGALNNFTGKNESLQLFAAAAGHSYSCTSVTVFMGAGVHLEFTRSRVQAYNIQNDSFGKPDLCKADQPDYSTPIIVAIILIILIVIVVIIYFVTRKRRTDGYQSL